MAEARVEAFTSPSEVWMAATKARRLPNILLQKIGFALRDQSGAVADKLGLSEADVDTVTRPMTVPDMLKTWIRKDTATVYVLKDVLEELGNRDALAGLEEGLQGLR